MAKNQSAPVNDGPVKIRVLIDCYLGKCNDVASVTREEADAAVASGVGDTTPEAVAYAETLPQNQPAD